VFAFYFSPLPFLPFLSLLGGVLSGGTRCEIWFLSRMCFSLFGRGEQRSPSRGGRLCMLVGPLGSGGTVLLRFSARFPFGLAFCFDAQLWSSLVSRDVVNEFDPSVPLPRLFAFWSFRWGSLNEILPSGLFFFIFFWKFGSLTWFFFKVPGVLFFRWRPVDFIDLQRVSMT